MSSGTVDSSATIPADLMKAALELPGPARAKFASALLESLDDAADKPEAVRHAWKTEIVRRIEEIRSGKVQLVDGTATLKRMREELREKHGV
jgi:hypothetical protein